MRIGIFGNEHQAGKRDLIRSLFDNIKRRGASIYVDSHFRAFLDAVNACEGEVYLKSPEGDIFNLKSSMSRYIAIGRLIEEQGDNLELFASRKEDQARLMPLVEDLMEENG